MTWTGLLLGITHFGNSVLLLCAASILACWASLGGAWRMAVLGWGALGTAVLLVLASKVAFMGWGWGIASMDFTGVSGHAMLSAAVLPVLALACVQHRPWRIQQVVLALSAALAAAVAWSRLELGAHSLSEVVAGAAIGAAVSAFVILRGRKNPLPSLSVLPLALALLVLLTATAPGQDGEGPRTHSLVIELALWASGRTQPFTREMLHTAVARQQVLS